MDAAEQGQLRRLAQENANHSQQWIRRICRGLLEALAALGKVDMAAMEEAHSEEANARRQLEQRLADTQSSVKQLKRKLADKSEEWAAERYRLRDEIERLKVELKDARADTVAAEAYALAMEELEGEARRNA
jgi:uncharacterized small protein (DUF1192 family)